MASQSTRQGNGRRKTTMEKIVNESYRHVTFSKRRKGLFNKAFELSIMTKAEIVIIAKSPGEKVYSFAYPSLEVVANKFLTGNPQPMSYMQQRILVQRNEQVTRKITELETVENELQDEIQRSKELDLTLSQSRNQYCGASKNLSQLKQIVAGLKNLKTIIKREIETRVLVRQQNYDAPTSIVDLHTQMLLSLGGPTYNGAGIRNGLPTLTGNNLYQVNGGSGNARGGGEGSGWSFINGINFFSGHTLSLSRALNVYDGNEGIGSCGVYHNAGNWSMNNGPRSSNGRGFPAYSRLNVYEFGEGSGSTSGNVYRDSDGTSLHNGSSSFSHGYSPYTRSLNINEGDQVNRSGGGSFYGGASGSLFNVGSGRGLTSTNGASSSGIAINNAGSFDGVAELDGSVPSHGFGVNFRYGSI